MVVCPKCGKRMGTPKKFCPNCGVPITITYGGSQTGSTQKTCPICLGTCTDTIGRPCKRCGAKGYIKVPK